MFPSAYFCFTASNTSFFTFVLVASSALLSAATTGATTSVIKFQYSSMLATCSLVFTSPSDTFLKPALWNNPDTRPRSAQRYKPGAPAGGFGSSRCLFTTLKVVVAHKFLSGENQTVVAKRPPGFSTRKISFVANSISGKNIYPKRQLMASNVLSAKGSTETSHTLVSTLVNPFFAAFSSATCSIPSARSEIGRASCRE